MSAVMWVAVDCGFEQPVFQDISLCHMIWWAVQTICYPINNPLSQSILVSQHSKKGKRREEINIQVPTYKQNKCQLLRRSYSALIPLMCYEEKMEVKVQLWKMKIRTKVGSVWFISYLSFRPPKIPKRRDLYGLNLGIVCARFREEYKFSVYSVRTFPF